MSCAAPRDVPRSDPAPPSAPLDRDTLSAACHRQCDMPRRPRDRVGQETIAAVAQKIAADAHRAPPIRLAADSSSTPPPPSAPDPAGYLYQIPRADGGGGVDDE